MDSRRNIPPAYDEHIRQASRTTRRASLPPVHHEPLPPLMLLQNKLASQEAEIEHLTMDNRKLASSHLLLRQDLVAAKEEAEKVREQIRSTRNEGDIEIRILLDKIAKMEADIRASYSSKKELEEAHTEARSLVTARLEFTTKIQQATTELDNSRSDVKKIPEMRMELDSLRQEHQRLRKTFEREKDMNIEKVEQMKNLEKDLINMAQEVERLRAEVLNAENRVSVPMSYSGHYVNSHNSFPPPFHGNGGGYVESFGVPHLHTVHGGYGSGGFAVGPTQVMGGPVVGGGVAGGGLAGGPAVVGVDVAGNPVWGGEVYDTSRNQM